MIIIECKKYCPRRENKTFSSRYNDYFPSIEYIDNKFKDILLKKKSSYEIIYRNLNGEYHNPIGPAIITITGNEKRNYYFINGKEIFKKK